MQECYLAFILFFIIATLYSSVGHAGASGYLAIMALLSFTPESIKPTSLVLNSIVASVATFKFIREGYFDKLIFFTVIVTSVPAAFIGGYLPVDTKLFKLVAGIFLILCALLLFLKEYLKPSAEVRNMPVLLGLALGAVIGLMSGLIGVGGGVFLSPIIIIAGWTTAKKASGIAALFILCNSITALAGNIASLNKVDHRIFYWLMAVLAGGILGSYLGAKKLNSKFIISLLFLVLFTAGLKFLMVW